MARGDNPFVSGNHSIGVKSNAVKRDCNGIGSVTDRYFAMNGMVVLNAVQ